MNGITEPLPGLLDDPQFQITDLPALTDFHIAPLRNPAPTRHANVPSPLEPLTDNILNNSRSTKSKKPSEDHIERKRGPKITPNDVLLAREAKKPHLAISELLDANNGPEIAPTHLPSFISLSVVEKSPVQAPTCLENSQGRKRSRHDVETEHISLDLIRRLPRPAQKDERPNRPAPLLPAMVTGLHEPPPSAALLPSIDVDSRPTMSRSGTTSKIHVKDILAAESNSRTPSTNIPHIVPAPEPSTQKHAEDSLTARPQEDIQTGTEYNQTVTATAWDEKKQVRRQRRKWTDEETRELIAGVKKYGVGKWKQILDDPSFHLPDRSSVDLKDRYRVCGYRYQVSTDDNHVTRLGGSSPNGSPPDAESTAVPTEVLPTATPSDNVAPPTSSINQAMSQKQRRRRRAWTDTEDANLLEGVAKHGFQWTAIHDDPELDLRHRRATDLRDRIRNKFPDGYRHAESAPLKSEARKAGKRRVSPSGAPSFEPGTVGTPLKLPDTRAVLGGDVSTQSNTSTPTPDRAAEGYSHRPTMTMLLHHDSDRDDPRERDKHEKDREKDKQKDQPGVTLPSFTLDVDDMDWGNNTLAPVHDWDDVGI
ncbi:hypothetical protein LTR10_020302 [Elasticomyces elasticus]|uniref:Myb-like domain-containing protein n=1 Tax=Exophiala sideris TaxID=1016849 RepID=A0ABR0J9J5_9EURO|nr:hypothetical protein LTR10_020302 [Elasticomyces elasticus]KAK5029959.1 hypothetical protein LTS07_005683 [Exophiala sideris]KAK5031601.1 hypothetical protein LTR13_007590 [Exophiala sideris]KAK5058279.1 hypothetical protein LTR69_006683 [Exophiala sideris]KAK5180208.1 hypothetical protein LTR44_007333 [Eurotiomycetes sp. CCFEE 6388]